MAVKLFLDNILLLEVYRIEGFSNRCNNDGMVNNYQLAVTSSNFKNLVLLKIVSNIVFDFSHASWVNY